MKISHIPTPHPYRRGSYNKKQVWSLAVLFVALLTYLLFYSDNAQQAQPRVVALALKAEPAEVSPDREVTVHVLLDNAGRLSSGVDIQLRYDPNMLDLLPVDDGKDEQASVYDLALDVKPASPNSFVSGKESSFSSLINENVNEQEGKISFSAVASPGEQLSGVLRVGSLKFRAQGPGRAFVSFVFENNSNSDTNVAYGGVDILQKVVGAEIIIR